MISEMKLFGQDGSAFVTRVKFALKLKGIDYEYIQEDLNNKSDFLPKLKPLFQRVPILVHGNEQPMIESLAIMEYLEEIKPDVHPLLPSSPAGRIQCRNFGYIFDNVVFPRMKEFMTTPNMERREELKGVIIELTMMLEQVFQQFSKGKPFFGGDHIGYVDIVVGVFLRWIKFFGVVYKFNVFEEDRNPKLMQWGKSMWEQEATRCVIPTHDGHIYFLKELLKFMKLPLVLELAALAHY